MSPAALRALAVSSLAVALLSCRAERAPDGEPEATPEALKAAPAAPTPAKNVYGAPISKAAPSALADVLKDPERFQGQNLVLGGHVRRACTRMGCWMELAASNDPSAPACRVTFHGHGFFVPKDSAGSEARVEGRLQVVRVSAAHAAHLEEEGARVADKGEDGSAREVHLVASGVELFRRGG